MSKITERQRRARRHLRLRQKVTGTAERPRLCLTRTLNHVHAQIVDDVAGRTLVAASSVEAVVRAQLQEIGTGNAKAAEQVGTLLAQRAQAKSIKQVVFDRGGNMYHGRVKTFAESARKAGLEF